MITLDEEPERLVSEVLDQGHLGILNWKRIFQTTQSWSYEKKQSLQLTLLRALGQEFDLPIDSWTDFYSLKPTTKDDLRGFAPHHAEIAIIHQTSGSSGVPFSFHRDAALESIDTAIFERAWSWVGRSRELVLRLVSGEPKWKYFDSFRNVTPKNYRTIDDSYAEWVIQKKPKIIHGVAGAIRDLTDRVLKQGRKDVLSEISLYLMSEDTRIHRQFLSQYYGGVYMGYGTAECRTVASQCGMGTLHVNMETSIAESIGGEIYATNLFNKVTPFIRYKTGDYGKVVQNKACQCGVVSDAIEGIEGKVIDYYYEEGMKRPTGWWLVSPISHQYGGLVSAWRLEVIPPKRVIRVYVVPRTQEIAGFQPYLRWVEGNTGFRAELVVSKDLPDWRRKLLRVLPS